jgi:hypothetical protein
MREAEYSAEERTSCPQNLAAALNMSQGFSLAAAGAIGRVLLAQLVEESPSGKLEANRLHESFLSFLRE